MTKAIAYTKMIAIRAAPETIEQIHKLAKKRRIKSSEWVRNALELAIQIENGSER
jgi:predicted DNA-binding protein